MPRDSPAEVAAVNVGLLVGEAAVMDHSHARLAGAQSGDVDVLQPEERHLRRRPVQQPGGGGAHGVGSAGGVARVYLLAEDLHRGVPLGVLVLHRLGPDEDVAHDEGLVLLRLRPQRRQQVGHVDVHVVVGLQHVGRGVAVDRDPLQEGDGLERQVAVGVHEVLLHDVPVPLALVHHPGLQLRGRGGAQQEHQRRVVAGVSGVGAPRVPHRLPILEVGYGRDDHDHQLCGGCAGGGWVYQEGVGMVPVQAGGVGLLRLALRRGVLRHLGQGAPWRRDVERHVGQQGFAPHVDAALQQ